MKLGKIKTELIEQEFLTLIEKTRMTSENVFLFVFISSFLSFGVSIFLI